MGRAALLGGVREPAQSRARLPASAPGASRAGLAHLAAAEGLTPAGRGGRGLLATPPQLLTSRENARLGEGELQEDSAAVVPVVPVEVRWACAAHLPALMERYGLSPALPVACGRSCPRWCLLPGVVVALS